MSLGASVEIAVTSAGDSKFTRTGPQSSLNNSSRESIRDLSWYCGLLKVYFHVRVYFLLQIDHDRILIRLVTRILWIGRVLTLGSKKLWSGFVWAIPKAIWRTKSISPSPSPMPRAPQRCLKNVNKIWPYGHKIYIAWYWGWQQEQRYLSKAVEVTGVKVS